MNKEFKLFFESLCVDLFGTQTLDKGKTPINILLENVIVDKETKLQPEDKARYQEILDNIDKVKSNIDSHKKFIELFKSLFDDFSDIKKENVVHVEEISYLGRKLVTSECAFNYLLEGYEVKDPKEEKLIDNTKKLIESCKVKLLEDNAVIKTNNLINYLFSDENTDDRVITRIKTFMESEEQLNDMLLKKPEDEDKRKRFLKLSRQFHKRNADKMRKKGFNRCADKFDSIRMDNKKVLKRGYGIIKLQMIISKSLEVIKEKVEYIEELIPLLKKLGG